MKKTTKWVIASVILSYAFWVIFPMINNAKPIGTVLNVDDENSFICLPAVVCAWILIQRLVNTA